MQQLKFAVDPGWKILFTDLGLNINEILKTADLPRDIFSHNDIYLSVDEYFNLWKAIEALSDNDSLPLIVGKTASPESFNPVFLAALSSPNLNIAMDRISKYKKLVGPMKIDVDVMESYTSIIVDCLNASDPIPDSLLATEFVFLVNLVRIATRDNIKPIFISSTSKIIQKKEYIEYFSMTPVKGEINEIRFSSWDASKPFLTENYGIWNFFEPELRKRISDMEAGDTYSSRVCAILFELLPTGIFSTEDVAKKMAISKRTLQRYLSNESTTFQKLLNQTRNKLAQHYLSNSNISVAEISFLLGFVDANSFARAFKGWTGEAPGRARAVLR